MDRTPDRRNEHGAILVVVLPVVSVLAVVAAAMVVTTSGEMLIAGRYGDRVGVRYAAHAASELATSALRSIDDWSAVVSGTAPSPFAGASAQAVLADASVLDLEALDAKHQSLSDAASQWGPNNPLWTRFVWGPMSELAITAAGPPPPYYLVAWVADDGEDGDGNPLADSNGVVQIHAAAYGRGGARHLVVAKVARVAPGPAGVRRVSWSDEG